VFISGKVLLFNSGDFGNLTGPHPAFFHFLLQTKTLPPFDAWVTLA